MKLAKQSIPLVVVCLVLVAIEFVHGAEPSLISIDDLYQFDSPQGLVVVPDLGSAVYSRRWADRASRSVRYSLWRVDGEADKRRVMEEGEPDARAPVLSPDGKWIVFHSTRPSSVFLAGKPASQPVPPYSEPATDLWLIPSRDPLPSGSMAVPLAGPDKPYGHVFNDPFYANVAFSPDGKRLVFVADDGADSRTPEEIANNVQIVREDQGESYEGYRPAQIWIADLFNEPSLFASTRITRVTHDDMWYGDPQWTPDGKSLVVHANRLGKRESVRSSINQNYDLWLIRLEDGLITPLTNGPGPEVSPRISPDGQWVVCLSSPRCGSHMDIFNLKVVAMPADGSSSDNGASSGLSKPSSARTAKPLDMFDYHGLDADNAPHLPAAFPLPRSCWRGNTAIEYSAPHRTGNRQERVPLITSLEIAEQPRQKALDSQNSQQAKLDAARNRLTPPSDSFLKDRIVAKGEVVSWKSVDGLEIEGIFTRPTTPDVKPPFKMVLHPHGGPHGRSILGFDFTVQVLAANGYAVFQPNFRGSSGYGQKFIDADRYDFGGKDMQDILTGIDHLVKQRLVNPKRQFVYGISYGGYTTCSLIAQTHQFRAAVPQNAVTDLTMMWGLSDIQSWTEWEFGGRPWEVAEAMRDHSPLTFASRVKTPTLILHATGDRRCPLPMGKAYYQVLKSNGVESIMVIYPDEGHPIKQLPHQEDVLRRILDWFSKHDESGD